MPRADPKALQPEAVLFVSSAIHGAIRMPLAVGSTTVGRSVASDLVLADQSVAGQHLRLHVAATIMVEALELPLSLGDAAPIEPGQTRVLTRTTEFRAGDVAMRVEIGPLPAAKSMLPGVRLAAAFAAFGFAGSVAFALLSSEPSRATVIPPMAARTEPAPAPAPSLAALQAQLQVRHLSSIQTDVLPDGSYRASGTINTDEVAIWHDVTHWFDEVAGGRTVLIDRVSASSNAPLLAIQSAWVGERPYVIDGSGQKLFAGAVLANGWTVEGIEADRVLVKRGGQRLAVRF